MVWVCVNALYGLSTSWVIIRGVISFWHHKNKGRSEGLASRYSASWNTKLISDLAKHQTETRSRSPASRNAKPKRETDLRLRKTPSRRTKPIKTFEKRLPAAGNGEKSPKNAFPPREMEKNARKTVSRGGKREKTLEKRFPAAGRR